MRTPLVLGNWKMNGSCASNESLIAGITSAPVANVEVGICPPALYLMQSSAWLKQRQTSVMLGAQDVSAYPAGAYTGEHSAAMLKEAGCSLVLVGHSERRQYHAESNVDTAMKAQQALSHGLTPVVCVGETLAQRQKGKTLAVVGDQLSAVIDVLGIERLRSCILAYEPVWAIGTGVVATPAQAQAVHEFLRQQLSHVGDEVRILYGGSVTADNASSLFEQSDIDGGLVGGASLIADRFVAICQAASALAL